MNAQSEEWITKYIDYESPEAGPKGGARRESPPCLSGASAVRSAWYIQQTQLGKYHTRCGHGFAAEDANALRDRLWGRSVDQVGRSNTINGPDRVSAGIPVQTKYCASGSESIKAAFDQGGRYRYPGQVLEVPPEQYGRVVEEMAIAIKEGRVDGVADAGRAAELVRSGSVTYEQSRRIARPANHDSICFDMKLHLGNAALSGAASFCWVCVLEDPEGKEFKQRVGAAATSAAASGVKALTSGVLTSQCLRTNAARKLTVTIRDGLRMIDKTSAGRRAINAVSRVSLGRAVTGMAPVNHCAKLMRSSLVGGVVSVAVGTVPDVARAMFGKISWSQVGRRSVEDLASTAGGMAGWTISFTVGSMACAAVMSGGVVLVGAAVFGTAGAYVGGEGARCAARKVVEGMIGRDTVNPPAAVMPAWLSSLLAANAASQAEGWLVRQFFQGEFRRWKRYDHSRSDSEAMELAKCEVLGYLSRVRAQSNGQASAAPKRAA